MSVMSQETGAQPRSPCGWQQPNWLRHQLCLPGFVSAAHRSQEFKPSTLTWKTWRSNWHLNQQVKCPPLCELFEDL